MGTENEHMEIATREERVAERSWLKGGWCRSRIPDRGVQHIQPPLNHLATDQSLSQVTMTNRFEPAARRDRGRNIL